MNLKRPITVSALTCLSALTLASCASIIHGTHQDVGITSVPTGAAVTVDNVSSGTTPVVAKLSRKDNHVVRVTLAGYQPYDMTLTRGVSGWVWGNIVFGGLVGLAVDAIDGGMYKLTPEQLSAAMSAGQASLGKSRDGIYLVAVLKPRAGWVKVAQLTPR
ncbi:MAG TPA: PEGA domain-containing protein [Steroidobacteraceae bacterium]|nr:PEGA domain-containing protein [Steroidobacteraceae bacterium]